MGGVRRRTPCSAGTTGLVAVQEGRRFLGFELSAEYAEMARRRIAQAERNVHPTLPLDTAV